MRLDWDEIYHIKVFMAGVGHEQKPGFDWRFAFGYRQTNIVGPDTCILVSSLCLFIQMVK